MIYERHFALSSTLSSGDCHMSLKYVSAGIKLGCSLRGCLTTSWPCSWCTLAAWTVMLQSVHSVSVVPQIHFGVRPFHLSIRGWEFWALLLYLVALSHDFSSHIIFPNPNFLFFEMSKWTISSCPSLDNQREYSIRLCLKTAVYMHNDVCEWWDLLENSMNVCFLCICACTCELFYVIKCHVGCP